MISFLFFEIPKIMLKDFFFFLNGSGDGRKFKGERKKNYKLSNQIVCVSVSIYIIIYKI